MNTLHFDGARFFDHSKYAYQLILSNGKYYQKVGTCFGTSHEAEYDGLIHGLEKAVELSISELHIIGDSQGVLQQITGRSKSKRNRDKLKKVHSLLELIPVFTVEWVPSKGNPAHQLFKSFS